MVNRLTRDRTRFRKTYSFYRQEPLPATLFLETDVVTVVSETIVREGSMFVDKYSARPSPSFQGAVFYATDTAQSFFYSGSQWLPFFGAGKLGVVPPATASWAPKSSYGTGSMALDRDSWLFTMPVNQQAATTSEDPALLAWVNVTPLPTGTATTVTLAIQNTTPVTSSVYTLAGVYLDEGGAFNFANVLASWAQFNPQDEDGDVALVSVTTGLETASSASAERGSNQEVWLRFEVTSSLTSSFTGSVGGNGGTVFRTVDKEALTVAPPATLRLAVGFIVGGGLGVPATFRVLSYEDVQVSA